MLCLMPGSGVREGTLLQEAHHSPPSLSQTNRHSQVSTERDSQTRRIILSCLGPEEAIPESARGKQPGSKATAVATVLPRLQGPRSLEAAALPRRVACTGPAGGLLQPPGPQLASCPHSTLTEPLPQKWVPLTLDPGSTKAQ